VPSEGSAGNDACEGALFGRGSALPAPKMLTPRKGTVARSVKDGFLANAAVELRADYETYIEASDLESGESPDWASLVKTTYGRTVYVDGAGRPTFVYQRVGDYDSSCGDGFGDYHSDLSGLSSAAPRRVPAQRFHTAPALLIDADGDGKFEVIGGDYDVTYYDEDGDYLYTAQRPYEGCPC